MRAKLVAESLFEIYGPRYVSSTTNDVSSTTNDVSSKDISNKTPIIGSTIEVANDRGLGNYKFTVYKREYEIEKREKELTGFPEEIYSVISDDGKIFFITRSDKNKKFTLDLDIQPIAPKTKTRTPKAKTSAQYYPKPDTAPWKLMKFFEKNPEKKFSMWQIYNQVGSGAAFQHGVEYLVKKGLIEQTHELNPASKKMANLFSLAKKTQFSKEMLYELEEILWKKFASETTSKIWYKEGWEDNEDPSFHALQDTIAVDNVFSAKDPQAYIKAINDEIEDFNDKHNTTFYFDIEPNIEDGGTIIWVPWEQIR